MNLTSKSRYALKIMLDLAANFEKKLVKRHEIVERQGIPAHYMDQIMVKLRKGGLVTSIRGRIGGYRIARDPRQISVWDVFQSVEDAIYPALCVDERAECAHEGSCSASEPWRQIFYSVRKALEQKYLADFKEIFEHRPMGQRIFECKSSRDILSGQGRDVRMKIGQVNERSIESEYMAD